METKNVFKSKKSFILVFTLICFIIILTLSVSLAWFTSGGNLEGESTFRFATVALTDTISTADYNFSTGAVSESRAITNLLPTQTIGYRGTASGGDIAYAGSIDAYYRISFEVSNIALRNGSDRILPSSDELLSVLSFGLGTLKTNNNVFGVVQPSGTIPRGYIVLSESAGNDYSNLSFTLKLKIVVIQTSQIESSGISGIGSGNNLMTTVENYQALFDYYDTVVDV